MKLLVYCATPSRMGSKLNEIMDHVTKEGNAPFHPFQAFPIERYEKGPIGREKSMEFCRRAIQMCDAFYLFGISEGALDDLIEGRRLGKPISQFVKKYDDEWEKYYNLFISKPKYRKVLLEVVGDK
jgi:hypothetical protein